MLLLLLLNLPVLLVLLLSELVELLLLPLFCKS